MIRQFRIPTKCSIVRRVWRAMECSWWPAIAFYSIVATLVIAANWSDL